MTEGYFLQKYVKEVAYFWNKNTNSAQYLLNNLIYNVEQF